MGRSFRSTRYNVDKTVDHEGRAMDEPLPRDERLHPLQVKIYAEMDPVKKLEIAGNLYWTARELEAAGLRKQHPQWTEEQVREAVTEIFLYART